MLFVPSSNQENTGAGTVPFDSVSDTRAVLLRREGYFQADAAVTLSSQDAEGVELPVFLTSRRLRQVAMIVGEYHEFSAAEVQRMSPAARLNDDGYSRTDARRGFFTARCLDR